MENIKKLSIPKAVLAALVISLLSTGCKKFLNVRPSTTTVNPTTISDFLQMLNNDSLALCNFTMADISSDDVRLTDAMVSGQPSIDYTNAWLWAPTVWNPGDQDFMYNSAYSRILQMNIILSKIDAAQDSAGQKNIVRAQAQINRAWYYLELANLYGWDYQTATATSGLAVPLVLSPDANALPARATVQQVYNQILQDLLAAVAAPGLPGMGATIVQPGRAAGFGLLATTYLYMGDYQQAESTADSALTIHNTLWNYNTSYFKPGNLLDLSQNPEILLGRLSIDYNFYSIYSGPFYISPTLDSLLGSNDTRFTKNFNSGGDNITSINANQIFNYSITTPAILLIKAECMARRGDGADAIGLLNQLRQNRLINYTPLAANVDALTEVLNERRRELFYHGGSRLFDLKRLNRESQFAQTLQRVADDGVTVVATLASGSPRYLMPFAPVIVANNPNIVQNAR
jgi:starch-binding outer membrane protein, SusD/RagB family